MNIYNEKPAIVSTVKEFHGWRTVITMDARELTEEEVAAARECGDLPVSDIAPNEDGNIIPGTGSVSDEPRTYWTATVIDVLHHITPQPDAEKVRQVIVDHINAQTDEKILSGFVWRGMPVWLSMENQFNYKGAYDIAVQNNGATLPVTFKLGERDGHPVYFTFNDMETFSDFYFSAIAYKDQCLKEGWAEKDSIEL